MCDEKLFYNISVNILPGAEILSCILTAKRLANDYACKVDFKFNGIRFSISSDTDIEEELNYYKLAIKRPT